MVGVQQHAAGGEQLAGLGVEPGEFGGRQPVQRGGREQRRGPFAGEGLARFGDPFGPAWIGEVALHHADPFGETGQRRTRDLQQHDVGVQRHHPRRREAFEQAPAEGARAAGGVDGGEAPVAAEEVFEQLEHRLVALLALADVALLLAVPAFEERHDLLGCGHLSSWGACPVESGVLCFEGYGERDVPSPR